MLKKAFLFSVLAASSVLATDLKVYGGLQDIKGDNDELKTIEARLTDVDSQNHIAGKLNFGFKKGGDYKLGDIEGLLGYEFGSPSGELGALRVFPLGLGYLYARNSNIRHEGKLHMLEYKAGVEYVKQGVFLPEMYANLAAYYTKVLKSSASYDGYKTTFSDYEPSGYEWEAELGYNFSNNFSAGVNVGYTDIDDDGFYLEKGWHTKLMVGYKF